MSMAIQAEELRKLLLKYKVKDCYISAHMIDIGCDSGWIYVNKIPEGFVEELDRVTEGEVTKERLFVRESKFGLEPDRTSMQYRLPNFIKDSKPIPKSTKPLKEQFIDLLKEYGVQNCYVTPKMDLTKRNPQGDIVIDTHSDALHECIMWLYFDYVNDLDLVEEDTFWFGVYTSYFDGDGDNWKPNFVVDGRYYNADF